MPNPNAIVGRIARLEPAVDGDPAQHIRAGRALSVEVGDAGLVRIDAAHEHAADQARILAELARLRRPVYIEIDPETKTIVRLYIPQVSTVARVQFVEAGLEVLLTFSQARYTLPPGKDYATFERLLRQAIGNRTVLIVSFNGAHEIVDVRPFRPGPDGELPPHLKPGGGPGGLINSILRWPIWPWRWLFWPCWWFGCMSMAKAQQVFNDMSAQSCDPLTIPVPCIPFLYPVDGCFARAHQMCRLMLQQSLSPRKVWIKGNLVAATRNRPNCFVYWGWHVAPTLCVWVWKPWWLLRRQTMVIDPSLFTGPVTEDTWKSVQGDPSATLTDTTADYYFFVYGIVTDPTYALTDSDLSYYRQQLYNDSLQYGPPPYANCP